ncbi:MAG: phosphatidate cytidylyltransferase [Flavobacteriales bacterium]|nr:phosphatidate cytidylyltransferase [Flavobacteriales bacterium]
MSLARNETTIRALTGAGIVAAIVGSLLCGPWVWWTLLLVLAYLGGQEAKRLFAMAFPSIPAFGRGVMSRLAVGLPFAALAVMGWREGVFVSSVPLGWFILLWTNDTAAYLVGRKWGRRKMAPAISPGKSWEGWSGGAVSTLLVAYFILGQTAMGLHATAWLVLGLIVSVLGPVGDLLESALKRRAGAKDSGQILPGHGGILDRFDSHALAAPLASILLQFL